MDLVAALATGAVGSVALARSDISDILPGVAIAISLVPPLAVVGLTLESGAPHQSLGALLLFTTNVVAILASGIVVMALYRVGPLVHRTASPTSGRGGAAALIGALLVVVAIPLGINSSRTNTTTVPQTDVQAVADHWATSAGWSVTGVTTRGQQILIDATGPNPAPHLSSLRQNLHDTGLGDVPVAVNLTRARYTTVSGG